jgi:hypothetical protein
VVSCSCKENNMTIRTDNLICRIRNLYSMNNLQYTSFVRMYLNSWLQLKVPNSWRWYFFYIYLISKFKIRNNTQTVVDDSNLFILDRHIVSVPGTATTRHTCTQYQFGSEMRHNYLQTTFKLKCRYSKRISFIK